MFTGVDTCARITSEQAKLLVDNGISFVGRYLVNPTMSKALTFAESKNLHNAGLGIVLIWETYASRAREGANAGNSDGLEASTIASSYGIPTNCTIYFAVDYDAPRSDYAMIEQYLYAAKTACSPYRCGVYGKADLINSVKADCYMQCVAWSGGLVSSKNNIYQYEWQDGAEAQRIQKATGIPVDMNASNNLELAGAWVPETSKPWYTDAMNWVKENGIMNDGRPNDYVTRAELAAVLMRYNSKIGK